MPRTHFIRSSNGQLHKYIGTIYTFFSFIWLIMYTGRGKMSKTRYECGQVIMKNWTQMTLGSKTLTINCNYRLFSMNHYWIKKQKNYYLQHFVGLLLAPQSARVIQNLPEFARVGKSRSKLTQVTQSQPDSAKASILCQGWPESSWLRLTLAKSDWPSLTQAYSDRLWLTLTDSSRLCLTKNESQLWLWLTLVDSVWLWLNRAESGQL